MVGQLDLVHLAVPADHHRHQLFLFAGVDQRLDQLRRLQAEEGGNLVDRLLVRRGDPAIRLLGARFRRRQLADGGLFGIGGIRRRVHDFRLAGVGDHHELVRRRAADGAGIGLHHGVVEFAGLEDPPIGIAHGDVGLVQAVAVRMEGVGVLHHELAAAHEAETRADFVAELGLDLVEVEGQLFVAAHVVPHQIGDHLFGGRREAEAAIVTVGHPQQFLAVNLPAARFLPKFGRLDGWHRQLAGAAFVELAADDRLQLGHAAQAEGQGGVDAGREFFDHAGADHQTVTDDFRVFGHFAGGEEVELSPAHRSSARKRLRIRVRCGTKGPAAGGCFL